MTSWHFQGYADWSGMDISIGISYVPHHTFFYNTLNNIMWNKVP